MGTISLNYGENPQQQGFVAADAGSPDPLAITRFTTPDGAPALSDAASMSWSTLKEFDNSLEAITRIAAAFEANVGPVPKIAVLTSRGTPFSAVAGGSDGVIKRAIENEFRSAFGAFLVTNVEITEQTAYKIRQWMGENRPFLGIAAPLIDANAAAYFARNRRKCHLLANPALSNLGRHTLRQELITHAIRGAIVSQQPNPYVPQFPESWDEALKGDMSLAWGICAASPSSCITVVKDKALISNAAGYVQLVTAAENAVLHARLTQRTEELKGAAVCSDSFFSFADAVDHLARRKVKAIFAPSGSVRDDEVREHAEKFDVLFHTVPANEGRIFYGH
ncbi:MAG: hypothetical protein K0U74_02715 [Alphaproteobacteria bacterium]|nr:hypothetical protein [Alphaproteobacteria bacterium]